MATAIYHGFLMHGLAAMLAGGRRDAKMTPSTFVLLWCLAFDGLWMTHSVLGLL